MNASIITELGNAAAFQSRSVETPQPKKDDVLIKVLFCGVNHLDVLIRQGKRPGPKIFPHVLGSEIVGKIDGETVCVYPWTFCGKCKQCREGNENICDHGGTLGRTQWGGYAEYVAVPAKNIVKLPKGIDPIEAASILLAGTTAYHLIKRAGVKPKSTVLVTGATGGVGTVVLQLLKNFKCRIICATSHPEKKVKLQSMGIENVVSTKSLVEDVHSLFPQGIEYAIDIVGGTIWSKALEALAKKGTLVFCSTSRDEPGIVPIAKAFNRELTILGSYGGTIKDMESILTLVSQKVIVPIVDSVFPLSEAQKAHERIENQAVFGKILLQTT